MSPAAATRNLERRIRRFWSERGALRRRLFNIGHLLTGNLFSSVTGILAFVLTARALGPTDYGILALTYSYVRAIEKLIAFQSWQPLIKYGAELQGPEHRDDYRALLKFGLIVDVSAAVAAYLVSVGLAYLLGPLFGIGDDALHQVMIYSTVLLFQINGLPTAVIRLAGRFRLVAYGMLAGGIARLALCALGLWIGADLLYFVVVWTVTQIMGSVSLLIFAFLELHRQAVTDLFRASLRGVTKRCKGLVVFTVGSNIELTLRSSANELDTLIVGMFADPASAGLYHIAKRMGRLILQLGVQVQAVLYPDVARLWAQRALAEFRSTVFQMEIILMLFGLMVFTTTALFVEPLLYWTAGPKFVAAAPLVIVQMIAVCLVLSGGAVRTALLAMGRQPAVLKIVAVATVAFHITAFAMIPLIGAMGANIAHCVMGMATLVGLIKVYRHDIAREVASEAATAAAPPEETPGPGHAIGEVPLSGLVRDRP